MDFRKMFRDYISGRDKEPFNNYFSSLFAMKHNIDNFFINMNHDVEKLLLFELIPSVIDSLPSYEWVIYFVFLYLSDTTTGNFACLQKLQEIMSVPRSNVFTRKYDFSYTQDDKRSSIEIFVYMIGTEGFFRLMEHLKVFRSEENIKYFIDFFKFCFKYFNTDDQNIILEYFYNMFLIDDKNLPIYVYRELINISIGTSYYELIHAKYLNLIKENNIPKDKVQQEINALLNYENLSSELNAELDNFILCNIEKIDNADILKNIASKKTSENHVFYDALYQRIQNSCFLCYMFFSNIKEKIKNKSFDYYFNQFQNDGYLIPFLFKYLIEFCESAKNSENLEFVINEGFDNNNLEIHNFLQFVTINKWIHPILNKLLLELVSNLSFTTNIKLICEFLNVIKPENFPYINITNFIYDYLNSTNIMLFFIRYSFLPIGDIECFWEFTEHDRIFFKLLENKGLDQILLIKDKLICEDCNFNEFKSLLLESYKKYPQNHCFLWKLSEICQDENVILLINELIKMEREKIGDEFVSLFNQKSNTTQIIKYLNLEPLYGINLQVQPSTDEAKAFLMLITNEINENQLLYLINSSSVFAKETAIQLVLKSDCEFDWKLVKNTLNFAVNNCHNYLRDLCLNLLNKRKIEHTKIFSKDEINYIIKDLKEDDIFEYFGKYLNSFQNLDDFLEVFKCILNNIESNKINTKKILDIYFSNEIPPFLRTNSSNKLVYDFINSQHNDLFSFLNSSVTFDKRYSLFSPTKSYILKILMSLDLTWNNLEKISGEIRGVFVSLLFNLSNDIDSKIVIDDFPHDLRKMFEVFIIQIKRQKVQTYLNIKPLNSVLESLQNEDILIMNSPKVLNLRFIDRLNDTFVVDEKIDTSSFSFSHNIYHLKAVVTKEKIVYKKHENHFINLDTMEFVDKLSNEEIQELFYEFVEEPFDIMKIWRSNKSFIKDINKDYFVQGFLDDMQDNFELIQFDNYNCKPILDFIYNYKLPKLFSRIKNNQFISEYFFDSNISEKFLNEKSNKLFKEQIIELAKNYTDTAGLIFLLSEKNKIDYEFAFEIINQRENIPYQTKLDLFTFFTRNSENLHKCESFQQFLTNLLKDKNTSVYDINQILRTYNYCFISLIKISNEDFIKFIPQDFYKNNYYLDIIIQNSEINFLLKIIENNLNPFVFIKSFSKIKYIDLTYLYNKISKNPEFKKDYKWIKEILCDKNSKTRMDGQKIMMEIWKNDETANKNITKLLEDILKEKIFYTEIINVIKYYIHWFDKSSEITKYYLICLFEQKNTFSEEALKLILPLPEIKPESICKSQKQREKLINSNQDYYCKLMLTLLSKTPAIVSYLYPPEKSFLEKNLENSEKQIQLILNLINNDNVVQSIEIFTMIPIKFNNLVIGSLKKIREFPKTTNTIFFLKYISSSLNLFDFDQKTCLENCNNCLKCVLKQQDIKFEEHVDTHDLIEQIIKNINQFLSSKGAKEEILLMELKFIKLMSFVSYNIINSIISFLETHNIYSISTSQVVLRKISSFVSKIFKDVIGDLQFIKGEKSDKTETIIRILNKQFSYCLSIQNSDFYMIQPYLFIYLYIFHDSFKCQPIRNQFISGLNGVKNLLLILNVNPIDSSKIQYLKKFIVYLIKYRVNTAALFNLSELKAIHYRLSQSIDVPLNKEKCEIVKFLVQRANKL